MEMSSYDRRWLYISAFALFLDNIGISALAHSLNNVRLHIRALAHFLNDNRSHCICDI